MRQQYHNGMNVLRQADPRANQKSRTRAALVAAAAALLDGGGRPTVAEAAEAAKISRATAYRYFPTQEALLVEALELTPMVRPVEAWVGALPATGAHPARLLELQDLFNRILFQKEVPMRTALRVYLDAWLAKRAAGERSPAVRPGRRMEWIEAALRPADRTLSKTQRRRLHAALALTLGVEALIVMKDVCQLDDDEALSVLRWAATTLLKAGLKA